MGVPHLRRHLEPYAQKGVIEPCNVVIDGPALAYHILALCLRSTQKSSPSEQPSYDVLGCTTVAWLDEIQASGLTVSAIYFDGFLPQSKYHERQQRVLRNSQDLSKYHQAYLNGVPKERPHATTEPPQVLFPQSLGVDKTKSKAPDPPFFVPAIIEYLKNHAVYSSLTAVVPGEADGFCAEYVRLNGGAVITSDSDLLVSALGPRGSAIFLGDIEKCAESKGLVAPQYCGPDICQRLSIEHGDGLCRLAFELTMEPTLSMPEIIRNTKMGIAAADFPEDYSLFLAKYSTPELGSSLKPGYEIHLDPRVSEIALRCLPGPKNKDRSSKNDQTEPESDDNDLQMYLPLLLDSPSRTSAWEASKSVRQLAYALLQSVKAAPIPIVSEVKRLQSVSLGAPLEIPRLSSIDKHGTALLAMVSKIRHAVGKSELVWVVLSMLQDVVLTKDHGKTSTPLSVQLLRLDAARKLDEGSWEFLHFLAQVQATCYSLRILQQILNFTKHHTHELSSVTSEVSQCLSALPPLGRFPSVRDFAETLARIRDMGGLSCLATICADDEELLPYLRKPAPSPQAVKPAKISKKSKRKATSQSGSARPRSSNPFDLLDNE
ncbi:XPG domain containing-domain-containing protein [Lasiosphaeria miniovina]|uniref:XPG domain containing-domain-containing protein n=1 Tax=Lasiosphaeria miniovina TaxID=1954250 RepID=A0AA40ALW3_9PEZI|nr:XPG domain containing-domain-containing protein [Lasiosphaeria miniovina]KAK0718258.1 XPG domain containing-domain-containing protein [Lasiosphaeria miniovina]